MAGPNRELLASHIAAFENANVICVGDIMLDRFIYGDVDRVSPEAPIPVCRVRNETAMLGGAGNVARNLVSLGARVDLISVVGCDPVAKDVELLLQNLNGVSPNLLSETERITTSKIRYVADGQQLLRADREITDPISDEVAKRLCVTVSDTLQNTDALIISDYGKGVITDYLANHLITLAADAGKPVIVDPKAANFNRYRGASLVTPNLKELGQAAGRQPKSDVAITTCARALLENFEIEAMVVTRGSQGMSLISTDGADHFTSRAREVFDVSGAGDTVVASLAAGLAVGLPTVVAAQLANLAAGIVVGKTGTAVAYADDLQQEIRYAAPRPTPPPPLNVALEQIRAWQARGETVGFTNGCFDLLHPGHVSLLAQARANCDRLVVGLNADRSVKRLKGNNRPTQDETARAAVLSSFETVDLVLIFEQDTPEELLHQIRPDILVKGADYKIETVVGADFVQSYGGRVILAEIVPGFSTTATIARMNSS
ncbi:MAG: D-glycero-beta-D-manno-heptose-7-phosphate kinase [Pseudomonadota bacterium]|nr:D-glycero-beta-D-manno-heptose-7-phosphate kinase [Pseudomonadota bacterium]